MEGLVAMTAVPKHSSPADTSPGEGADFDVIIVGAGISGIGAAYRIAERNPGLRYVILERRAQIGGTWDVFRYPGDMFSSIKNFHQPNEATCRAAG